MTIYINYYDNDNITEIEVEDKIVNTLLTVDEGEPKYNRAEKKFRDILKAKKLEGIAEAYTTRELAELCFSPFLCW